MEQDIAAIAAKNKEIIAEGKRLCREINQGINNHDVVVSCLRKVGINVKSRPKKLVDVLKYYLFP